MIATIARRIIEQKAQVAADRWRHEVSVAAPWRAVADCGCTSRHDSECIHRLHFDASSPIRWRCLCACHRANRAGGAS